MSLLEKLKKKTLKNMDLLLRTNLSKQTTKSKTDQFNTNPQNQKKYKTEEGKIIIRSLWQYRKELEKGNTDFDFSELDCKFEDIQNLDLENLNLNINLREVFVPFDGSRMIGNNIISSVFNTYTGDYFLEINKSRLGGNNVTGDLSFFDIKRKYSEPVYVWYSEKTFDDEYKNQYPQFFLSKDAPKELKEKYYNPQILIDKVADPAAVIHDLENKYREIEILKRQVLSLDEYIKYYEFLKGKYLGNFYINKFDLQKINLIEKYGLSKAKVLFNNIDEIVEDISKLDNFESYKINNIDEHGISLSLNLKYNENHKEEFK